MTRPTARFARVLVVGGCAMAGCAMAGCAMPERADVTSVAVQPPSGWSTPATPGEVDADWWRKLGEPDLIATIERTLARNHDLQAAYSRLVAATAQARLAGASLGPKLDAGFDANRQRSVFVGLPFGGGGPLSNTFNGFGINLNASWEADLWNRLGAGEDGALADVQASASELRGLRQSLAAQTAKAWYAAVEAREQVALATRTSASYTTTEQQVEDRFRRGVRTALDLRLARTQLRSAEAQLHQWEEVFARAIRQLQVLQGLYPDGRSKVAERLPEATGPIRAGVPARLIARRPDLVAAERRLAAAGFRVEAAQAALYPQLSLSGRIGTTSDHVSDLLDLDFLVWNLASNLVAPILDGGARRGQRDLAIARENEAIAEFAQSALRAYSEVETLLAADGLLRQRLVSLTAASAESRAAEVLSADRYRRGLGDFIAVLSAQRGTLAIDGQLLTARRQLLDLRVDLHLALGGGFESGRDSLSTSTTNRQPR